MREQHDLIDERVCSDQNRRSLRRAPANVILTRGGEHIRARQDDREIQDEDQNVDWQIKGSLPRAASPDEQARHPAIIPWPEEH